MAFEKSKELVRSFKLELTVYQRVLRDNRTPLAREIVACPGRRVPLHAVRFDSGLHSGHRSPGRRDHCTCASFRGGSLSAA